MKEQENKTLQRQLKPINVWAIAFGCIIGWGAFVNPGKKFLPNSGVAGTAIAMVLGAAVMIVIAFSYAYMIPKYPKAGGEFTFTKECFGKKLAFVCGWFLVAAYLTNVPMNSTAIGLIVDGLDGNANILKFGFHYTVAGFEIYFGEMLFATIILIVMGILNILGVKKAAFIQTVLSGLLAISVFVLAIAALFSAKAKGIHMEPIWGFNKAEAMAVNATADTIGSFAHQGSKGILSAVLATFAIAPWAYVGFDTIPQVAEEFNFSYKKVIAVMVIAILFGCFVYTTNNAVTAAVLEDWPERVMAGEWVLLVAAEQMLGVFGKVLIGLAVFSAVLSGIMGFYLASSRLLYSMAQDAYLTKTLGKLDSKYGTPKNAILFCMLISLTGPVLGREALGWFLDMSAIGASMAFFFTSTCAYKKMREDNACGTLLKVMAVLGVVFSLIFMTLQLIPIPALRGVCISKESYIMLGVWITLGILLYLYKKPEKTVP